MTTIRRFITATGFVSAATLGLATYAPRPHAIDFQAALSEPRRGHRGPARRPSLKPPTIRRPNTGRGQAPDYPGARE